MQLEKGYIYHIYNQGNNHRKIFFKRENYLFFLKKVKTYFLPYCDIIAWALMPNHFHFMVLVKETELLVADNIQGFTPSEALNKKPTRLRTFNDSIGIMLRSYTRAINKQEGFSGSLFRAETKAECVNCPNGITPSFITKNGITELNINNPDKEYPQVLFNYIHQNPVKAKYVAEANDWEFSSAQDYANIRKGKLINKETAKEYVLW
ncbi:MAG: hypothetical protein JXL97_10355 [Bacteroidales bacterium]|nr:hypothetical protein [Bacteroidales bacterium]